MNYMSFTKLGFVFGLVRRSTVVWRPSYPFTRTIKRRPVGDH